MNKTSIILTVILVIVAGGYGLYKYMFSPGFIASLIKNDIESCSIIFAKNDVKLINRNPDVMRPLASTVKIIIAIEFAEQIAANKILPDEVVNLADLDKYYIENTDGGAHVKWLSYLEETGQNKHNITTLWQVAYGMIKYSSNANTEYLIDRLGMDNVNNRIKLLGLAHHEKIFYLVSSLFLATRIDQFNNDELHAACIEIHQKLKTGQLTADSLNLAANLDLKSQKKLSDRLPGATAGEYYTLLERINKRNYFNTKTQFELDRLMEWPIENSQNESWIKRIGGKGGSTLWILNNAVYLQKINGDRYEFVFFSNHLSDANNNYLISKAMNNFLLTIFSDSTQSAKIIKTINNN